MKAYINLNNKIYTTNAVKTEDNYISFSLENDDVSLNVLVDTNDDAEERDITFVRNSSIINNKITKIQQEYKLYYNEDTDSVEVFVVSNNAIDSCSVCCNCEDSIDSATNICDCSSNDENVNKAVKKTRKKKVEKVARTGGRLIKQIPTPTCTGNVAPTLMATGYGGADYKNFYSVGHFPKLGVLEVWEDDSIIVDDNTNDIPLIPNAKEGDCIIIPIPNATEDMNGGIQLLNNTSSDSEIALF